MKRYGNLRINFFLGIVFLASSLILYRLFILSVIRHSTYLLTAQAQNESINNILARGNIYLSEKDSNLFLAATNKKFPLVYIVPADIKIDKKDELVESLAGILNLDSDEIKKQVDSGSKSLRVLARRISNEQIEKIKGLGIKGTGVSYEVDRFIPGAIWPLILSVF